MGTARHTASALQPGWAREGARARLPGPAWVRAGLMWALAAWSAPGKGWIPPVRDACTAGILTVIMVLAEEAEAYPVQPSNRIALAGHHQPGMPAAALLLVAAAGIALAWRARYPRLVLSCSTAAVVAFALLGYVTGAALLLPAVALGTLSRLSPIPRAAAWGVVVTAVTMVAVAVNNPFGPFGGGWILVPADFAVALLAGIALASRRAYVDSVQSQAARQAAQEAQRRVEEERLRIARELHDVVAHTMATITVQAAAASQLLRDRPDEAAESLKAVRAASKDGLRELRAILDVLRTADSAADATQPTPSLSRLDALVASVRAAGLPVTVTVTGRQRNLPAVTGLSAFRIIQEALTNTLRHAGPATAAVAVDYGHDELRVEITDTGRGLTDSAAEAAYAAFVIEAGSPAAVSRDPAGVSPGHGLRGMRERAAAAGGTIEIGPRCEGGFRVAAALPLAPAPTGKPAQEKAGR